MAEKEGNVTQKKRRSRILYEITVLVVILMIVSGLATAFFINNTFDRLVNKSIDKLVQEEAKTIHSGLDYMAETELKAIMGDISKYTPQQLAQMAAQQSAQMTALATERFRALVKENVLGLKAIFDMNSQNTIFVSTDANLLGKEPPKEVLSALEKAKAGGANYVYLKKGIPVLGFKGEYLLSFYGMSNLSPLLSGYWGIQVVSMHDAVTSINNFYNSEKNRATLIIGIIVGVSVILVIIITFFVLSFLIRTQITAPVDELSDAAEQVMQGNLDVKLDVREGEEFEGLKRAFKEMVESIRKYIDKSTGEG